MYMQVSYGAADTIFNNMRARFPFFHRTLPSYEAVNIGILELMRVMNWNTVALLSSADPTYSRVRNFYCNSCVYPTIITPLLELRFYVDPT